MKFYLTKPIRVFLFYCLINFSLFSQNKHEKVFLQMSGGNTTYIHPSTKTNSFAPSAEAILIGSFNKSDSTKIEGCFLAGVTFTHSTEQYDVLWSTSNSNQPVRDNFFTNEFLFNVGGMIRGKLTKRVSLNFAFGMQFGPNYTWTDDPNGSVYMGRLTSTSSPEWLYTLYSGQAGPHYKTTTRITAYKWEYYQFYLFGTAQLEIKINKRTAFILGAIPRFFFAKNKISEEIDGPEFNSAPLKVNLKAGLQFKLFK